MYLLLPSHHTLPSISLENRQPLDFDFVGTASFLHSSFSSFFSSGYRNYRDSDCTFTVICPDEKIENP
jgi:hypothetical protein